LLNLAILDTYVSVNSTLVSVNLTHNPRKSEPRVLRVSTAIYQYPPRFMA
jgi:hypothetical protein